MKIQRTIFNAEKNLRHFSNNNFRFENFKFLDLNRLIPKHEMDEFGINCRISMTNGELCRRGYELSLKVIFGETDEQLKFAKKRYPYFYTFFRLIHIVFLLTVLKLTQKLTMYVYKTYFADNIL